MCDSELTQKAFHQGCWPTHTFREQTLRDSKATRAHVHRHRPNPLNVFRLSWSSGLGCLYQHSPVWPQILAKNPEGNLWLHLYWLVYIYTCQYRQDTSNKSRDRESNIIFIDQYQYWFLLIIISNKWYAESKCSKSKNNVNFISF